ncbi:MAG: DOMON domain-containing protein [bacterium]
MNNNLSRVVLFTITILSVVFAQKPEGKTNQVIPYDGALSEVVWVDGTVDADEQEFTGTLTDQVTGITINWLYSDSLLYIALSSKGTGWMAIGFGSPKMDKSNIIIGYYTDDSTNLENHIGSGWSHKPANIDLIEDWEIDYDDETDTMVIEFTYPLKWTGLNGTAISELIPGQSYNLILARNSKSSSLAAKHAQKASYTFTLAPKPEPVPEEDSTQNKK